MIFRKFLIAIALMTYQAAAFAATDRDLKATTITNPSGGAVFTLPVTTPTASRVASFDANGALASSSMTTTELAALTGISAAQSNELFVDKLTGNDSNTCTVIKPCATIGAALTLIGNAANATEYNDADHGYYIVNVAPETYSENLTIPLRPYIQLNLQGVQVIGNVTWNALGSTLQTGAIKKAKLVLAGNDSRSTYTGSNYAVTGIIGDVSISSTSTAQLVFQLENTGIGGNVSLLNSPTAAVMLFFATNSIITGTTTAASGSQITLYASSGNKSSTLAIGAITGQVLLHSLDNVNFTGALTISAGTNNADHWFNVKFPTAAHDFTGSTQNVYADANSIASFESKVSNRGTWNPTYADKSNGVGYTPTTSGDWSSAPTTVLGALDNLASTREKNLTFNAPLSRSTNTISCTAASGSVNGCLSSTDWTTFNSKENALTFNSPLSRSTNTISLPNFTGDSGSGGAAGAVPAPAAGDAAASKYLKADGTWATVSGSGTVTSVALSLPSELSVSGSPVTSSGTLSGSWGNQTTNKIFAAPNGSTGTPSFRALVSADIPVPLTLTGASDANQLVVKSNATQTTKTVSIQDSTGAEILGIDSSGNVRQKQTVGTASAPNFSVINSGTTQSGLYVDSTSVNLSHNGVQRWGCTSTICVTADTIQAAAGTVSAPAYAINGAASTGLYWIGVGNIGLSCAGTKCLDLTTSATTTPGNLILSAAGKGIQVKEGSNAKMGQSTLVAGTVTVSTTAALTNSRIFLTHAVAGGTLGTLSVGTITNATSFVINSTSATDTSTINWIIIDPS